MELKKIEADDFQPAATLLRNYWKERGMEYSQEWTLNYLANGHKTEIKKEQTFVLKEQDKVIGTISLVIYEGDVAEIRDLVVKKEFRKKGYGRKLLEQVIDYAKRNQVRKIYGLVFQQNRFFMEKFGFELEGYLKDHFKDGEHLLLMSRYFREKEERQVDLKQKLEETQKVKEIEEETSGRLMKLALRK